MARAALVGLAAVAVAATTALTAAPASAIPGGRIELSDQPTRTVDTRDPQRPEFGRTTEISIGSGVLQVWAVDPVAVGTAVIHPCADAAPTDRFTFRLDPGQPIQYHRIFTSEEQCLSSTASLHVIVDDGGRVETDATAVDDQYVALAAPVPISTETIRQNTTLTLPRPPQLTADASAAVIGIEALLGDDAGFVTAYGCDSPRSFFADLSYSRGIVANVAAVAAEPGEDLCIYSSAEVTLRTTLLGELRDDGPTPEALPPTWGFVRGPVRAPSLRAINPVRVLDTRRPGPTGSSDGRLDADETLELSFGDLVGPLTTAVSMNVTAATASSDGFLTVWPCDGGRPEASNLNFGTSGAVPNLVVTSLSPGRTVCISPSRPVDVIVDVNGTYERDGGLHAVPVDPERILDTRDAIGTAIRGRIAAGNEIELQVTGGDVPAGAGAATMNVTATGSDANGFVTVYPCDSARPTASNLNFRAGEATPNLVTTALSATGSVCLYASESVHLIADLASWYGLDEPAGLVDLAPTRVLDTRSANGVTTTTRISPGRTVVLDVASTSSVAVGANAVVMNVTAAQAAGIGFVTAWPCDQPRPTVSNLNVRPGRTVANLATVSLSATGTVCLATSSATHLIADIAGYLTDVPVDGDALVLGS